MKNSYISIDFGTTRTKMAYIDNNTGKAELFRIGEDDKPYIPSLFYISNEGEIFCGDDALFLGKDDPIGLLDQPLKRSLRESIIIAGNGQKTTPKILLQTLFLKLREKIRQHPDFSREINDKIVLTIPAQYGPSDEMLIRDAAVDAGFKDEYLTFLPEPIAAAQAWISENNQQADLLIVLDCGGGTLDWACLKQPKSGLFELVHDLPPGGDNRIGGYDIDEELYKQILTNLPKDEVGFFRSNRNLILKQIQAVKEKFSKTKQDGTLSLSKIKYNISVTDIEGIVKKRFINQAISSISPYIERVNTKYGCSKPDLLLVGGSSRFPMLYDELIKHVNCNPVIWERSEYATVLGAVNCCSSVTPKESSKNNGKEIMILCPDTHETYKRLLGAILQVATKKRGESMEQSRTHAQACYTIINGKASSNQWIQGLAGIVGFPFAIMADVAVVPAIYEPLWRELRSVYGHSPVSVDSTVPVIKNIIPEVLSDLLLDKILGQIPLIGAYFNLICAKHMTWRLGTLFSMLSARGDAVVSSNIKDCMKLIRMLFPQEGQFSFTTPDRATFIKLVTSVSNVSPDDYKSKIRKGLVAME